MVNTMEQIRAFIAIELPEKQRKFLSHLQSMVSKNTGISAKWVDPYGIHLTLKFLGNITTVQVEEIKGAMAGATAGISPFSLDLGRLGVFPNPRRVRVIWVGITGDTETLVKLQKRVEDNLSPLGFTPEERAFTPHLTLARVRDAISPEQGQRLEQLLNSYTAEESNQFAVNSTNLMRSQLSRQGAFYSQIYALGLG
jgi:2'-5' RNA ligase